MLGEVTSADILVFLVFLAPQLVIQIGLVDTIRCALNALPFLVFQLPLELTRERALPKYQSRSRSVQRTSLFQDVALRCVRYAFANIPASIGAVFFSKGVALPFYQFRLLRHWHLHSPFHYEEIKSANAKGLWIVLNPRKAPDVVIYYCHGGGFAMGSTYFYLEFLTAWLSQLKSRQGWQNPAAFSLEYTLVPDASFPRQLEECRAGYDFTVKRLGRGNLDRLCLAGDSAGATLVMSLLLSNTIQSMNGKNSERLAGFVTLISPWCKLISDKNANTSTDYLNASSLHTYALQYLGRFANCRNWCKGSVEGSETSWKELAKSYSLASPGDCEDKMAWSLISKHHFHIIYGSEEVFAPETKAYISELQQQGAQVDVTEKEDIHAWPIVSLFLGKGNDRVEGLDRIVELMGRNMIN